MWIFVKKNFIPEFPENFFNYVADYLPLIFFARRIIFWQWILQAQPFDQKRNLDISICYPGGMTTCRTDKMVYSIPSGASTDFCHFSSFSELRTLFSGDSTDMVAPIPVYHEPTAKWLAAVILSCLSSAHHLQLYFVNSVIPRRTGERCTCHVSHSQLITRLYIEKAKNDSKYNVGVVSPLAFFQWMKLCESEWRDMEWDWFYIM